MTMHTPMPDEGGQHVKIGKERFRPQFHFTARKNWINDPNGLVYFEGEYHLFFQHNPYGKDWGNMSWGHAVSDDLLTWRELPIAIPQTDQMIFSGSVVVDWQNTSGLGDGRDPPLLAYFTAFDTERDIQSQHMAFSHDRGRSFTHYSGNPILDLDAADFRDPKVFYHDPSGAWIMVVVLARAHVIQFYRSQNMRDWTVAGTFGPQGAITGQWECPDLILVSVEGATDQSHWVLKVDVDEGPVDGGSGAQYFVGSFDGYTFSVHPDLGDPCGALVDYGPDFYAAATWFNLPATQPGPVWIGWQSNHQTGRHYPTHPWRGAMSLPRMLFLFEEEGRLRLGQKPIAATDGLRSEVTSLVPDLLEHGANLTLGNSAKAFWQHLGLIDNGDGRVEVTVDDSSGPLLTIELDFVGQQIIFRRHVIGADTVMPQVNQFGRLMKIKLSQMVRVDLDLIVDGSSIEIFVNGGRRVYSACVFPQGPTGMCVRAISGATSIGQATSWLMGSAMSF